MPEGFLPTGFPSVVQLVPVRFAVLEGEILDRLLVDESIPLETRIGLGREVEKSSGEDPRVFVDMEADYKDRTRQLRDRLYDLSGSSGGDEEEQLFRESLSNALSAVLDEWKAQAGIAAAIHDRITWEGALFDERLSFAVHRQNLYTYFKERVERFFQEKGEEPLHIDETYEFFDAAFEKLRHDFWNLEGETLEEVAEKRSRLDDAERELKKSYEDFLRSLQRAKTGVFGEYIEDWCYAENDFAHLDYLIALDFIYHDDATKRTVAERLAGDYQRSAELTAAAESATAMMLSLDAAAEEAILKQRAERLAVAHKRLLNEADRDMSWAVSLGYRSPVGVAPKLDVRATIVERRDETGRKVRELQVETSLAAVPEEFGVDWKPEPLEISEVALDEVPDAEWTRLRMRKEDAEKAYRISLRVRGEGSNVARGETYMALRRKGAPPTVGPAVASIENFEIIREAGDVPVQTADLGSSAGEVFVYSREPFCARGTYSVKTRGSGLFPAICRQKDGKVSTRIFGSKATYIFEGDAANPLRERTETLQTTSDRETLRAGSGSGRARVQIDGCVRRLAAGKIDTCWFALYGWADGKKGRAHGLIELDRSDPITVKAYERGWALAEILFPDGESVNDKGETLSFETKGSLLAATRGYLREGIRLREPFRVEEEEVFVLAAPERIVDGETIPFVLSRAQVRTARGRVPEPPACGFDDDGNAVGWGRLLLSVERPHPNPFSLCKPDGEEISHALWEDFVPSPDAAAAGERFTISATDSWVTSSEKTPHHDIVLVFEVDGSQSRKAVLRYGRLDEYQSVTTLENHGLAGLGARHRGGGTGGSVADSFFGSEDEPESIADSRPGTGTGTREPPIADSFQGSGGGQSHAPGGLEGTFFGSEDTTGAEILALADPWNNPRVQRIMADWLGAARPLESLRISSFTYNKYAQVVGPGIVYTRAPDAAARLGRHCWLWSIANVVPSTNMGTLMEYIRNQLLGEGIPDFVPPDRNRGAGRGGPRGLDRLVGSWKGKTEITEGFYIKAPPRKKDK